MPLPLWEILIFIGAIARLFFKCTPKTACGFPGKSPNYGMRWKNVGVALASERPWLVVDDKDGDSPFGAKPPMSYPAIRGGVDS